MKQFYRKLHIECLKPRQLVCQLAQVDLPPMLYVHLMMSKSERAATHELHNQHDEEGHGHFVLLEIRGDAAVAAVVRLNYRQSSNKAPPLE